MDNGKIFISYRREDTSGESGRLKDKLEQVFGSENIFYDVETLEPGWNFDESIAKALNESKVLLAMIGPHWLKVEDSQGIKRIVKPNDWVRKEIAEALKRDLRVIPVLVNGAEMPESEDLPEDLKELSLKHAQELTSSRWNYDVGELQKVLEKLIAINSESSPSINPEPYHKPEPKSRWAKNYLWAIGGIIVLAILYFVFGLSSEVITSDTTENFSGVEILERENSDQELPDLAGKWVLYLDGVEGKFVSTCIFVQNGPTLTFKEYNSEGDTIGEGSGTIEGLSISLDYYSLADVQEGIITLNSNNAGQNWFGELKYPATNETYKSVLSKN